MEIYFEVAHVMSSVFSANAGGRIRMHADYPIVYTTFEMFFAVCPDKARYPMIILFVDSGRDSQHLWRKSITSKTQSRWI